MCESKLFELTYSYPKYSERMHIIHSSFFLGVFSSVEKVKNAIEFYSALPGFSRDANRFSVRPLNLKNTSIIYRAGIAYIAEKEKDDTEETLGYYETEETAKKTVRENPLYKNFRDHLIIEPVTVDQKEWTEGFVEEGHLAANEDL